MEEANYWKGVLKKGCASFLFSLVVCIPEDQQTAGSCEPQQL